LGIEDPTNGFYAPSFYGKGVVAENAVAEQLIDIMDVVIENFRPGVTTNSCDAVPTEFSFRTRATCRGPTISRS
jgi:hypothetical protein